MGAVPVAEGKLGEKGIVHEAQLGKVVEPLGGSDELGPRREVGGVGPHGLPVRLRGAGPGGGGGRGGGGGGGSGGSSVSGGVYGDGGGVCVAGNVCCRRRPSYTYGFARCKTNMLVRYRADERV